MPTNKLHLPERDSVIKHKREFLTQILLPIVLSTLAVVGLVAYLAFATLSGGGGLGNAKDISLIWLMLPMFLSSLVSLAALVLAIYGMSWLLQHTEPITGLVQNKVYVVNEKIRDFAAKLVKPVINAKAWMGYLSRKKG